MENTENREKECKYLNKTYGKGYYICNGLLKPVDETECENCKYKMI